MAQPELPYSDELITRFTETVAKYRRDYGPHDHVAGLGAERLATGLLNNGIGLVDTSRRAFLVDLDVYQGSQQRLRAAEARIADLEAELARTAGLAKDLTTEPVAP